MQQFRVKLKTASSRILVGPGLYRQLRRRLEEEGLRGPFLVVSQQRVLNAIDPRPLQRLNTAVIPEGERAKTLRTVERLLDGMLELEMNRESTLIAIGGGVVGDVAGFAASVFLRGISVVQVPTTLLAQVDSSIGGKTGVNHSRGKNLIGTFHQPRLVLADTGLLDTLPERDYRSGLYEILKYGVIRDRALFRMFERMPDRIAAREPQVVEELVYRSLGIKGRVVALDEKERGLRQILNFGHTIGHAIEAASRYRSIRHGEAVGYGMIGASRIATRIGLLDGAAGARIEAAIASIGPLPPISQLSKDAMMDAMRHDKKVKNHRLHFVLPERIGAVTIRSDVGQRTVRAVLNGLVGR